MKYHEIGERFGYDGVILEVVELGIKDDCPFCYFFDKKCNLSELPCSASSRLDKKQVIYKLVEQCDTKDMEQKTEIERIEEEKRKIENNMAGHTPNRKNETIAMNDIIDNLKQTLVAKNEDYGSAFSEMFDELGIDYAYGKLREKINRIKVLRNKPNMVENEGLEDALLDTAGYAILTLVELKKRKGNENTKQD